MDVIMEFATPVGMFYTSDEQLTKDLYDNVLVISEDKSTSNWDDISKTTQDNLHNNKNFKILVDHIEKNIKNFSEEVLGIKKDDLLLDSMWANIHNSCSKHHYHQHPNSFLSGVYYPYIPECKDPGNIVFVDPRQAKNMTHADFFKSSCISNRNIWVTPQTGLLLIFPSWLEHGTDPFITQSPTDKRVAISFNYKLTSCSQNTMRI